MASSDRPNGDRGGLLAPDSQEDDSIVAFDDDWEPPPQPVRQPTRYYSTRPGGIQGASPEQRLGANLQQNPHNRTSGSSPAGHGSPAAGPSSARPAATGGAGTPSRPASVGSRGSLPDTPHSGWKSVAKNSSETKGGRRTGPSPLSSASNASSRAATSPGTPTRPRTKAPAKLAIASPAQSPQWPRARLFSTHGPGRTLVPETSEPESAAAGTSRLNLFSSYAASEFTTDELSLSRPLQPRTEGNGNGEDDVPVPTLVYRDIPPPVQSSNEKSSSSDMSLDNVQVVSSKAEDPGQSQSQKDSLPHSHPSTASTISVESSDPLSQTSEVRAYARDVSMGYDEAQKEVSPGDPRAFDSIPDEALEMYSDDELLQYSTEDPRPLVGGTFYGTSSKIAARLPDPSPPTPKPPLGLAPAPTVPLVEKTPEPEAVPETRRPPRISASPDHEMVQCSEGEDNDSGSDSTGSIPVSPQLKRPATPSSEIFSSPTLKRQKSDEPSNPVLPSSARDTVPQTPEYVMDAAEINSNVGPDAQGKASIPDVPADLASNGENGHPRLGDGFDPPQAGLVEPRQTATESGIRRHHLTATSVAQHQHFRCEKFLYQVSMVSTGTGPKPKPELDAWTEALLRRGNEHENAIVRSLENHATTDPNFFFHLFQNKDLSTDEAIRKIMGDVREAYEKRWGKDSGDESGEQVEEVEFWYSQLPLKIPSSIAPPPDNIDDDGHRFSISFGTMFPDFLVIRLRPVGKRPGERKGKDSSDSRKGRDSLDSRKGKDSLDSRKGKDSLDFLAPWKAVAEWFVVDAKSSKRAKGTHMIQIALYHSALHELFAQHDTGEQDIHFVGHRDGAVWLPISRPDGSAQDTSSQAALEHFPVSVLLPRVRDLLQSVIPGLLKKRQPELDWHLNPICKPCDFSDRCREEVGERFGSLPGISLSDRAVLQTVRRCEFGADEISDIEDLLSNPDGAGVQPQKLKQVRKILKASGTGESALIQARRLGTSVLLPGPNLHLPKHEDVAVFIYLLTNPESEDFVLENGTAGAIRSGHAFGLLAAYEIRISCTCESPQSFFESASPSNHRRAEGEMLSKSLVRDLASIMRTLDGLKSKPIVQFYCWSALEVRVLNRILLAAAVQSQLDGNSWVDLQDDVESCIAALVTDPAACTSPIVPSPFEQSYFSGLFEAAHQATKKGNSRTLPLEVLKKLWLSFRSQTEPKSMTAAKKTIKHGLGDAASKALNGKTGGSRFPRILDLEGSMKHTVVLPVAGWVAFMDYLRILLPKKESTPSEGDLFDLWRTEQTDRLHGSLHRRLQLMEALLKRTRRLARNALRFDASHWFAHLVPELGAPAILGPAERALLRRLFFIEEHEHNLKLRQLQLERSARDTAIQLRLINEFNYEFSVVDQNQVAQLELDSSGGSNAHLRFSRYILGRESDADDFADFKDLAFASAMMKAHAFSAAESIGNLSFASIASIYRNDAGQICCRAVLDNNINIGHRDRDSLFILRDRLFDLNYPKVMKMLFFYGQTGGSNTLFTKLLLRPHDGGGSPADSTAWKENGDKIQELWEKLRRSDAAVPLSMTYSQRLAFESMTDSRLTVIWGPPGAGKTHTLALSCTRFLHIAWRIQEKPKMRILFTATTTAAIETFLRKLFDLIDLASEQQALIEGFEGFKWAENASANVSLLTTGEVFHGKKAILGHYRNQSVNGGGQNQDTGAENGNGDQNRDVWICAGTIWQVYNLQHRLLLDEFDVVIIDEASQMPVSHALIPISLAKEQGSRVIVAGDHLQLAPILQGKYPKPDPTDPDDIYLSSSIMECLMRDEDGKSIQLDVLARGLRTRTRARATRTVGVTRILTDNFRMDRPLASFTQLAYNSTFDPVNDEKRSGRRVALLGGLDEIGHELAVIDGLGASPSPDTTSTLASFLQALDTIPPNRPQSLVTIALCFDPSEVAKVSFDSLVTKVSEVATKVVLGLRCLDRAGREAEADNDDERVDPLRIFVATPHRIQRSSIEIALQNSGSGAAQAAQGDVAETPEAGCWQSDRTRIRIDTTERLQGDEADVVIVDYSYVVSQSCTPTSEKELDFTWKTNRLHVGVSRAKSLCIVVVPRTVLTIPDSEITNLGTAWAQVGLSGRKPPPHGPPLEVLASPEQRQGWGYMNRFANGSGLVWAWPVRFGEQLQDSQRSSQVSQVVSDEFEQLAVDLDGDGGGEEGLLLPDDSQHPNLNPNSSPNREAPTGLETRALAGLGLIASDENLDDFGPDDDDDDGDDAVQQALLEDSGIRYRLLREERDGTFAFARSVQAQLDRAGRNHGGPSGY